METTTRITLTFIGLCLTIITFGQAKPQEKWINVISELNKANFGDTISFMSKNNLEWSDFKKEPNLNNFSNANLELTFRVLSKKVNIWTGIITVESYGGIRRDLSWVNPKYKSQQFLKYLQLKYEIGHYFAKLLENEINSKKINAGNVNKINGIIESNLNARDKALNTFDIESNYGSNLEVIDNWRQKLSNNEI